MIQPRFPNWRRRARSSGDSRKPNAFGSGRSRSPPTTFPRCSISGLFYSRVRRFADAEPLLKRVPQTSPGEFQRLVYVGLGSLELGSNGRCAARLARSSQIATRQSPPDAGHGSRILEGPLFLEAAKLAGRAVEIDGNNLNAMLLAIKSYQVAGDDAAAGDIARNAVERFPDSARANFERGVPSAKGRQHRGGERAFATRHEGRPVVRRAFLLLWQPPG